MSEGGREGRREGGRKRGKKRGSEGVRKRGREGEKRIMMKKSFSEDERVHVNFLHFSFPPSFSLCVCV